jgi:hypothetical protein
MKGPCRSPERCSGLWLLKAFRLFPAFLSLDSLSPPEGNVLTSQ